MVRAKDVRFFPLRRENGPSRRFSRWLLCGALTLACTEEKPPAPDPKPDGVANAAAATEASLDPSTGGLLLTYPADRGAFKDASKVADVPESSRGIVRVMVASGPKPPAGQVWVTNLDQLSEDGKLALHAISIDSFEEAALTGRSSAFALPPDLQPPEQVAETGQVIVYKTEWCGVCKQLLAYLDKKGVDYVAKDIEKDREAAAELQAKASAKGVSTGSVPMIDVKGELLVGFDKGRLEELL